MFSEKEKQVLLKQGMDAIAKADADMAIWAEERIASIPDEGGILDLGFSLDFYYRVYHARKILVLQNPEQLSDEDWQIMHKKVTDIFAKIGWTVSSGAN